MRGPVVVLRQQLLHVGFALHRRAVPRRFERRAQEYHPYQKHVMAITSQQFARVQTDPLRLEGNELDSFLVSCDDSLLRWKNQVSRP